MKKTKLTHYHWVNCLHLYWALCWTKAYSWSATATSFEQISFFHFICVWNVRVLDIYRAGGCVCAAYGPAPCQVQVCFVLIYWNYLHWTWMLHGLNLRFLLFMNKCFKLACFICAPSLLFLIISYCVVLCWWAFPHLGFSQGWCNEIDGHSRGHWQTVTSRLHILRLSLTKIQISSTVQFMSHQTGTRATYRFPT